MVDRPKVDNAPGLVWRRRSASWVAEWHARTDLAKRGWTPTSVPLWRGNEPSELERSYISDQCNRLQTEMLVWGRGGIPQMVAFDGTLRTLIRAYQTDEASSYRKLRYVTRIGYDGLMRRIERDHGDELVQKIKGRDVHNWHEQWIAGGHVTQAHALVGMLRTLAGFGSTLLDDEECERLAVVLHRMRFQMGKSRVECITADQVIAIRNTAREMGLHSLALAQAFQFECMLRQKDVIGEWVPLSEPGTSDVTAGGEKWLRGLRWSEIDQNLVLRHTTSKRQKDIEVNLRLAPMVMDELERFIMRNRAVPASGPIIISEQTGQPYTAPAFRYHWRRAARAAGVPENVRNMDSRAGAISEATDAGAELEHVRHAATHGDISMTQKYSRASTEKTAVVMRLRTAHRNKSEQGN